MLTGISHDDVIAMLRGSRLGGAGDAGGTARPWQLPAGFRCQVLLQQPALQQGICRLVRSCPGCCCALTWWYGIPGILQLAGAAAD